MATVYLAEDVRHRRRVAIKVLDPELSAVLGAERFVREIEIAAKLSHPHVLPLYDSGEAGAFLYYVMPYVEGESLRARLAREVQLPVEESLRIAREVADALDYAHREGVVHRDVKPENILLTGSPPPAGRHGDVHALVADFGIARAIAVTGADRLTATGLVVGTPAYMNPEQAVGDAVDARSDVYSLACVVHEMLTGEPPFTGATPQVILARRFAQAAPSVHGARPSVPAHVEAALARALERAPADRFATAAEFAAALSMPVTPGPLSGATPDMSIAVLPFANLSPDPDNAFFADGLTDELISDLSKVSALRVISRASAMRFKGTTKDVPTISRELNTRYILDGSVRRAGNSLRITAQLIDGATDRYVWADKYAGRCDDVFDLQEQLSRTIVEALRVRLSPEDQRRLGERPIVDARAYDCYLRARQEIFRFNTESLDRALHLAEQGLQLVGDNELLFATMGLIHWQYLNIGARADAETFRLADEYAQKALAMNPSSAQGLFVKGLVAQRANDIENAVRHLRRSASVQPTGDAFVWLGLFLLQSGREGEARAYAAQGVELDPLMSWNVAIHGYVTLAAGDADTGYAEVHRAHEMDPSDMAALFTLALCAAYTGRPAEALGFFESIATTAAPVPPALIAAFGHALRGNREAVRAAAAALNRAAVADEWFHLWTAEALAVVGERDEALRRLSEAVRRGWINYRFLGERDPLLASLRGDPGFEMLLSQARRRCEAFDA